MLQSIGRWGREKASQHRPWTNVYGLARTLLALATALTLLSNHSSTLFRPVMGSASLVQGAHPLQRLGLFFLVPEGQLELARWIAIVLLLITASGWRPRVMAIPHWWVSLSLQMNAVVVDGGDQLTAVLCLLLLPVALTDRRRWHWGRPVAAPSKEREVVAHLAALMGLVLIRVQMAGIYFHAAVGKYAVEEWADGTALYYWLTHPLFGAPDWLAPTLRPFLTTGFSVGILTWSVILVEVVLAAGLIASKKHWRTLLLLGIWLHLGIVLVHGLVSFSMAMIAGLVLFYRPPEETFALVRAHRTVGVRSA